MLSGDDVSCRPREGRLRVGVARCGDVGSCRGRRCGWGICLRWEADVSRSRCGLRPDAGFRGRHDVSYQRRQLRVTCKHWPIGG